MIKTIKKAILMGLAGALGYLPMQAKAEPKVNLNAIGIVAEDQKPLKRYEALVRNLPLNSDIYATRDGLKNKNVHKFRLQSVPLEYGILSVGVAGQSVEVTGSKEHEEAGLVLRLKGKPTENSFAKADTRWFIERDEIDGYMFFSTPKTFADCLWKYSLEKDSGFFRPGFDYKITDNLTVGVEGKFKGDIDNLNKDYIGARVAVRR